MQKSTQEKKKITLPLEDFLDILIGDRLDVPVSYSLGVLLKSLDPLEDLIHVEKRASIYFVWRIHYWRTSVEREEKTKKRSERDRKQYWLDEENIAIVCRALAKKLKITNREVLKPLAVRIIKERSTEANELLKTISLDKLELEIKLEE